MQRVHVAPPDRGFRRCPKPTNPANGLPRPRRVLQDGDGRAEFVLGGVHPGALLRHPGLSDHRLLLLAARLRRWVVVRLRALRRLPTTRG